MNKEKITSKKEQINIFAFAGKIVKESGRIKLRKENGNYLPNSVLRWEDKEEEKVK